MKLNLLSKQFSNATALLLLIAGIITISVGGCSTSAPPEMTKSQEEWPEKAPIDGSASPNNQVNAQASSQVSQASPQVTQASTQLNIAEYCIKQFSEIPGSFDKESLRLACDQIQLLDTCKSTKGQPIFHYERLGTDPKGKRVLTFSLIHGDELSSGSVSRAWIARLNSLDPRNTWRIIPIVNPDGVKAKTRYNANKVDLNRNFPSQDWDNQALKYWEQKTRKDTRRYPGPAAESEIETRCLVRHIKEFNPDFVISVHTPLGVLDFDGPKIQQPGFKPLPWVGLGNYSGSLGRYMWVDNKVPVLTIELKGNSGIKRLEDFDKLQDISGTVAIQSGKILDQEKR